MPNPGRATDAPAGSQSTDRSTADPETASADDPILRRAVAELIAMQEPDGAWPYEGVYRVQGEIPVGYRIGGTALVCQALLYGTSKNEEQAAQAIRRGIARIFKDMKDPRMKPSDEDAYDVRVWGHACALECFCRLLAAERAGDDAARIKKGIRGLVKALLKEEHQGGGWNYAGRRQHASFVTGPVIHALLWAKEQGVSVPDEVFARTGRILKASRLKSGAYHYSGTRATNSPGDDRAAIPGSIGRAPLCESTLVLLGEGDPQDVQRSLDAFHEHWIELEKRRKQQGTHAGPYGVAPYYFYFAHRYAAQAIQTLPPADRSKARDRLRDTLMKTRDKDGTWNDRVFSRSRNFGTAMAVLVLAGDRVPLPPRGTPAKSDP